MSFQRAHSEPHYVNRSGWLRAAVLGANDGIVSISALLVGVAAAGADAKAVALAGVAGVVAGAMSMAAGEYVSVSSQADTERADIAREKQWLHSNADAEEAELASIYIARGLSAETAAQVARELTEHDALDAHVRDELGLSEVHSANPFQAAIASGLTFCVAGALPFLAAMMAPAGAIIAWVVVATILALVALGAVGAKVGGAPMGRAILRVVLWGLLALALTAGIGRIFGIAA